MKAFLDLIPLVAFFITMKNFGVVEAAAALLISTLVVHIIHFFQQNKKLDKQQIIVLILTVVFCGITILLNDDFYIKIKSSIINGVFVVALIGSILINKPIMKLALNQVFILSDNGWKKLTLVWAVFFTIMGFLHYYTAFHMSKEIWTDFKSWGWIPIMFTFMIGQFAVLKNHINPEVLENTEKEK